MAVVVVTDSSARLPADLLGQWGIRVVPLHILLDGTDLRDGVDEVPADIHQRAATTAAATPAELADAYQQALADSGGDGVVAVHISSALSGTCRAAERTAADLDPNLRVVDSKSAAMADAARAAAWLGTALALKPLLRIDDGKLVLAQRVRTAGHATEAMIDRVCQVIGDGAAALAVHHVDNPGGAARGGGHRVVQQPGS